MSIAHLNGTDLFYTEYGTGLPHSQLVVFENSGHFPMLEERDKFTQAVKDWLRLSK